MRRNIILAVIVAIAGTGLTGCYTDWVYFEGNGIIVTETLDVEPFDAIRMEGLEDVDITWGETQEVVVVGDENIIERIQTDVVRGTWEMQLMNGRYKNYDLKYYLTVPKINAITNKGLSRVVVNDFVNEGNLDIVIEGSGHVELNRMENTESLYVNIDGLGLVEGFGEFPDLKQLDVIITGSGHFDAYPIVANDCFVDITGAGKCEVSVLDNLDVFIEGAGIVNYKGYPSIQQDISGLGTVQSKN